MSDETNRILLAHGQEIDKLRERLHDHSNVISAHTALLEALAERMAAEDDDTNEKLDAIHESLRAGVNEMRSQLTEHDRSIERLKGGIIVLAAGLPLLSALLIFFLDQAILR